ncbi:hypothetical protein JCM16163A_48110 [Paenibacillus sp. YK5]
MRWEWLGKTFCFKTSKRISYAAAGLFMWMVGCYAAPAASASGISPGLTADVVHSSPAAAPVIPTVENHAPLVTVVSVPGLSFMELRPEWLYSMPALRHLSEEGDWGAMNVRLPFRGLESVYATWGAGAPADGRGAEGWNRTERREGQRADELLERFSISAAKDQDAAAVVIPSIEAVRRSNARGTYGARPGLLGETLKRHGIRLAVWGNVDKPGSGTEMYRRPAPLMVMDEWGRIETGDAGRSLLGMNEAMPYGVLTRFERVFEVWKKAAAEESAPSGTLALIELGDLHRLYAEKDMYASELFVLRKQAVLEQLDRFIGRLAAEMAASGKRHVLWLVSPQPHAEALKEKLQLTPLLRWSPGHTAGSGLLTSETTRRPGIVSAVDIAPSMLAEFGVTRPEEMTGLAVRHAEPIGGTDRSQDGALSWLLREVERMSSVYALRSPILYGVAGFEVVVMLAGLAAVWFGAAGRRWWRRLLRGLLFSVLLTPGILLALGWLIQLDTWIWVTLLLLGLSGAVLGGAASGFRGVPQLIRLLCLSGLGISGLILLDLYTGAEAMKRSVLGYDAMIGARYYGIGNELMGVLLGASLLGLSAWLQTRRPRTPEASAPRGRAWAAAAGCALTGSLASPALGANAGGALAAAAGFGALAARLGAGGALRWRRLALGLALPLGAALAGLWLLNAAWSPGHAVGPSAAASAPAAASAAGAGHSSHIGRAFGDLLQGRYDVIGAMIARKLAMNWHLIRVSAWSKVLLTALAVMAVLVFRPQGRLRRWEERYPYLIHGCYANVIGAAAALVLNDSGIVAAGTMIVYSSVPLLLLRLEDA